MGCPETSVRNYHYSLRHNPELSSQLCFSTKFRTFYQFTKKSLNRSTINLISTQPKPLTDQKLYLLHHTLGAAFVQTVLLLVCVLEPQVRMSAGTYTRAFLSSSPYLQVNSAPQPISSVSLPIRCHPAIYTSNYNPPPPPPTNHTSPIFLYFIFFLCERPPGRLLL
jgi:hypothetical protein